MEKQKLIYVESKAQFSPSSVSNKAIVFIKDTKEIWTHGTYFICSNVWVTPITLTLSGDSTGSVSIDGSKGVTLTANNKYLTGVTHISDYNDAAPMLSQKLVYCARIGSGSVNGFPMSNNANAVLAVNTHDADYTHQLGFSSNRGIYHRTRNAGTWETSWREILTSTNYTKYPHTFASLTNKPTTISGYGITDSIPIIKGGSVTTDTDLSTLGMTTSGAKLSVFHQREGPYPTWLNVPYMNVLMFRSTTDSYGAIGMEMMGNNTVQFIGGRNAETSTNNIPNWWFKIRGTSGQTYNLATIQTAINNLGSTYLPLTGGTLTDTLILKAGAFTASNSNSYSGGRYQAVAKPNIRLIGDSTYGLSTIEFTSQKGDTSINKPSDSGFIQFQPYGVSALSSVGSHPTLKTSGESNALVLGVTNDADDIIVLQSPNISGLRHACGATEYYLPHITTSTTTANKPLVSTTTAHVYTLGAECLPLSGGTMTGKITLWSSNADAANTGGLNANNSNIYGLNSLYFADPSETAAEGINFYRSSTTVDSLWGSNGNLYWTPNRTYGNAGTNYYVLTSNNYSTHLNNTYLPLSGGVMTGQIQMTRGSSYLIDTGYSYGMLGMTNSGDTATGMNSEEGMYINVPFTQATLRTSGNNLWHYNHANSARYLILDANNYTNYTIPYAKANSFTGILPIINNEKLYHNDSIKFLYFTTSDNGGAISYLLIAELTNYDTGTNTSYINYGLVGTIYGYRGGNMANTHAYNVSVGASIGSMTFTRVYTSTITDALVPMIVKYDSKYYIALQKSGSSTGHYFIGQATNLLSSYITVNDSSLIEIIIKPSGEVSTGIKYYNGGDPKYYLHEGNYSNYALPLSGGTLTGTLTSSNITPRASVTYNIGTTSAYYNNIYAQYFKRKDSSDSYVLLGGGGHKLLSELSIGSADKLNTTRYFWGREFNGTQDVNGQINIVRNSGFASYNEGVRIQASSTEWAGIFLGTDGTDKGYITSQWNISKTNSDSLRISRGATSNYLLDIISNGNVGIGTTSPSEKLQVNGNAIIGTDSANSSLTIKSQNSNGVAYLHFDNGYYAYGDEYWKGYIAVSGWGDTTMRTEGNGLPGENQVIHGMIFKLPRIDMGDFAFRNGRDQDVARISTWGVIVAKAGFKVSGGTPSQFLKADGSLDSTSYLKVDSTNGTSAGVSTLLNKLTTGSSTPVDADYYICQYAGGGTTTTTYHRRPTSALYSYIRAKLYNSTSNYFIMGNGDLLSKEDVYSIGSYTAVKNSYYTGNAMYYYWYKIEFPESSSGSASATYSIMINDDNNYPRFSHYILNIKRYYANNIYGNSYQLTHLGGTSQNIMLWIANDSTPNLYIQCPCAYGEYGLRIKCIYGTNKFNPTPIEYNSGGMASSFTIINKYLDQCSVRVNSTGVVTHTYGNIIKTDIVGNVTGTATSADKLNTNAGNSTTPVYFSNGVPVACTAYSSATVNKANFLACTDKRNNYPAQIVTAGGNIGASFIHKSMLGGAEGTWYDAIVLRGYVDDSAGNENALLFSKNTSSVYHSQYAFGSTTTWGTLYKFLDSGNYKNYAPSLSGEGATGTWGINISGTANKVANALTLQLNGGTTSGTNKFVYDGASAYTVNITPDSIGAATSSHNHDDAYLKLTGGTLGSRSATQTVFRTQSSAATLRLLSFSDGCNYIQSGNSALNDNADLIITGYLGNIGSNLYLKFTNIYCRGSNYTNIDSGNYSSYALPLSGGTMTGAINTANIYPKTHAGFNIGSTSSYYNTMYAYYFKKYGSDDNYLLLGGGGHKKVSDFPQIQDKGIEGGNGGNTDNWVLVLNNNYSTGWYGPCTMFYIRSKNFGCGILCFYHYWNTEGTSGYYDNSVWFFGAEHSAYSGTMGGIGRDINNYLKVYIDKQNADLKIYYNRYNNQALNVQELQFVHGPSGTLYPSGELRASHFINSTQVVELPTTSNTFVNIPIQTVKNHTEDIKTTRSVYASAFYENSDIRLKENVHSIDQIDLLKKVDLVQFNFKNNQNKKYGVIAQQLEQVGLNNLVYEHNGNKAVDYISLLVLETQRLRNEIKELKERLDKKELSS